MKTNDKYTKYIYDLEDIPVISEEGIVQDNGMYAALFKRMSHSITSSMPKDEPIYVIVE